MAESVYTLWYKKTLCKTKKEKIRFFEVKLNLHITKTTSEKIMITYIQCIYSTD